MKMHGEVVRIKKMRVNSTSSHSNHFAHKIIHALSISSTKETNTNANNVTRNKAATAE
jgi:hypothetical protein